MKLIIYKGFDNAFLKGIDSIPLVNTSAEEKKNVFLFDKTLKRKIEAALLSLDENDTRWMTYEEFALVKESLEIHIKEYGIEAVIVRNNLYPDYYPLEVSIDEKSKKEIIDSFEFFDKGNYRDISELCKKYIDIYSSLIVIDGVVYSSFYNYEYERLYPISVEEYYQVDDSVLSDCGNYDYKIYLSEDIESYLEDYHYIKKNNIKAIGFSSTENLFAKSLEKSLLAFCSVNGITVTKSHETIDEDDSVYADLVEIAKNDIGIPNFPGFRKLRFYKDPDVNNELISVSQATIINDIIQQAELSYDDETYTKAKDVFITAPTGAGKSVIFQVPAVYIAKKYKKLTIIIEPVKALMQDQKEQLIERGYNRVEAFNSDLITQVEKEAVIKRIKDGEIDLLYLSPETLLSYSIDTLIGDREIGLIIVDEAHIVTSWGYGFRPDYWYLGGYINKLRQIAKYGGSDKNRKTYHFPICALTATAINGGDDDSVRETIISLSMNDPIKYIGCVKRDDIDFDIQVKSASKQPKADYEQQKTQALSDRIVNWLDDEEKTIVYFPYAKDAEHAYNCYEQFAGLSDVVDKSVIGLYTGSIDFASKEAIKAFKNDAYENFKKGNKTIMFATKAFGMGVDINDILNVYHYAATGNLADYVQEIGRAARKQGMQGHAITDYFYNDINYINSLFGMSQIKQYQIDMVLAGVYHTYKNKGTRSFLITPEAFTYIFNGKGDDKDNQRCINKLKTCLLMLEKDLYTKSHFKVLVSRPQSVFTKAYVVVDDDKKNTVLNSKYGSYFDFAQAGRNKELDGSKGGTAVTDVGDVYIINLKEIWENFYPNISFPQFKRYYFMSNEERKRSKDKNIIDIMPEIRPHIHPRQRVSVEALHGNKLSDISRIIYEDLHYVADVINEKYKNQQRYFTINELAHLLGKRFGLSRAHVIANAILGIIDPDKNCIKNKNGKNDEMQYYISNGTFRSLATGVIAESNLVRLFNHYDSTTISKYVSFNTRNSGSDSADAKALKLLSVFDLISYEIVGGQEPEIYIRINDPERIKRIVNKSTRYTNDYVTNARKKHDRDVAVLRTFFTKTMSTDERWDYIERYFLGENVVDETIINSIKDTIKPRTNAKDVSLDNYIDKEKSYLYHETWENVKEFYDEETVKPFVYAGIRVPDFIDVTMKKDLFKGGVAMAWLEESILAFNETIDEPDLKACNSFGWKVISLESVNADDLKELFK